MPINSITSTPHFKKIGQLILEESIAIPRDQELSRAHATLIGITQQAYEAIIDRYPFFSEADKTRVIIAYIRGRIAAEDLEKILKKMKQSPTSSSSGK